ncbi:unnamed protein product [Arctia plantaginis]|uniref:Uncharacterized protein n=1 Tax=Arctia plantaginis TaxID=874455 RepID=A0A8S0ZJ84_ARCPL|nr:unnamed protein product [Arctia plantaginis]
MHVLDCVGVNSEIVRNVLPNHNELFELSLVKCSVIGESGGSQVSYHCERDSNCDATAFNYNEQQTHSDTIE